MEPGRQARVKKEASSPEASNPNPASADDCPRSTCRGLLPAIRGMFASLRFFDASNNTFDGFIPGAWSDTGIVRLVR